MKRLAFGHVTQGEALRQKPVIEGNKSKRVELRSKQPNREQGEYETYELILQALRNVLAQKIPLVRVKRVSNISARSQMPTAEIVIEVSGVPITKSKVLGSKQVQRGLKDFFENVKMQEAFIEWLAKRIGQRIPEDSPAKSLETKFMHLKVGRHGKLPPRAVLETEYRKLILEFKAVQIQRPERHLELTNEDRKAITELGRKTCASWVHLVERGVIGLDQIVSDSPEGTAKFALAKLHGTSEDNIHARLFHNYK
jgi:hypothetical protein